jgi:hypothetical protein
VLLGPEGSVVEKDRCGWKRWGFRIRARALVTGNHVLSAEPFKIDSFININIKLYIESCRLYVI